MYLHKRISCSSRKSSFDSFNWQQNMNMTTIFLLLYVPAIVTNPPGLLTLARRVLKGWGKTLHILLFSFQYIILNYSQVLFVKTSQQKPRISVVASETHCLLLLRFQGHLTAPFRSNFCSSWFLKARSSAHINHSKPQRIPCKTNMNRESSLFHISLQSQVFVSFSSSSCAAEC